MTDPRDMTAFSAAAGVRDGQSAAAWMSETVISDIRRVRELLSGVDEPPRAIHSTRKLLKRCRAVLRLAVGDVAASKARNHLRDAARLISAAREAAVMVELAEELADMEQAIIGTRKAEQLIDSLEERHVHLLSEVDDLLTVSVPEYLLLAEGAVDNVGAEVELDAGALAAAAGREYTRGRAARDLATLTRTSHDLHEWRKRVKSLRHQLEALVGPEDAVFAAGIEDLDLLGDLLGREHDLSELTDIVSGDASLIPDPEQRVRILEALGELRTECRQEALELGSGLFARPPSEFVERLRDRLESAAGRGR